MDLDPFAVNIARLRLWLSLMVDYEGDDPPPLPNLEFKIETGDSLTAPAPAPLQADLFRQRDVEEFFTLKGRFMTAHGPEKKVLKAQIDALKATIAGWASEESGADAFDWAVDFAEVFTPQADAAPGFDIIVANPPYVRQELLGAALKATLKKRYPDVYTGTADLYVYFYARALQLLREGGVASFITSNKWLRAGYGEKLRQSLNTQTTVQAIIDFGDLPVFGAIAYPQIIVFRKAAPAADHPVRALTVDDLSVVDHLSEVAQAAAWEQPRSSLRADGWTLVRPTIIALMNKLRYAGKPLGELIEGKFYRGITTGLNEAFVIDQITRDRLITEDPRSSEIIKPWIRGRDIDRWRVDFSGLYLIFARRGIDISAYTAIADYLQQFKNRLIPGIPGGRKPGPYQWYEIQDSTAYYSEFEKPKIIYPDIAKEPEFTYDEVGMYGGNTMYILPTDGLFLLGILNSSVVNYFYRQTSPSIQQGYLRFIATYMERIPIPDPTPDQRAAIEGLVRKLLDARGQGPQVAAWEAELNARVYQVYGLTAEEIAVIEGK